MVNPILSGPDAFTLRDKLRRVAMYQPCTSAAAHTGEQRGVTGTTKGSLTSGEHSLTRTSATDQEWAHNPKVAGSSPAPATRLPLDGD